MQDGRQRVTDPAPSVQPIRPPAHVRSPRSSSSSSRHLGVGIVFTLVFVSRDAGVKFFRFNAGLAAILLAIALAFRYGALGRPTSTRAALGVSAARARRAPRRRSWSTGRRSAATLASIRPAIVAVGVRRRRWSRSSRRRSRVGRPVAAPMQALTVASFLSSAALLGGACTAMILGHWYLVIPSMQVSHLQSIVKVHIASMVVRVVVVVAAVCSGDRDVAARARAELPPLHPVGRRHLLLAARAVRPGRAGGAVVSHVGNREDPLDAVGDRHSLRRFLHRRRRRGAREVHRCSRRACPCSTAERFADCTAVRNLCNFSLRTASGPEGSSAKQILTCAAGPPGRGSVRKRDSHRALSAPISPAIASMSYQVIARKWRPQRFDDVVGQQAVTRTLRNALAERAARAGVRLRRTARRRQDDDGAHPGARAELRERADRRSVRRRATPASRSPKGATSTCSRSTPPPTPASTTSAR